MLLATPESWSVEAPPQPVPYGAEGGFLMGWNHSPSFMLPTPRMHSMASVLESQPRRKSRSLHNFTPPNPVGRQSASAADTDRPAIPGLQWPGSGAPHLARQFKACRQFGL